MTIQVLSADVAAKIAAGEVVERPANVAKELLENSLDADATEIRVEIREGGQRLLRVLDNGYGVEAAEVALAFERHATSKLRTADDLAQIATFGFRGEALYSIAAVSHMSMTTRARPYDAGDGEEKPDAQFGVQIRLEGGELVEQSKAGTPVGTVVSVEHLFFNMPARRKFLRKAATEAGHIAAVIQRYALAYPARRFSFVNDGRLVFQSTGSGDLFDVLVKIYGLENAKQMIPVGGVNAPKATDPDELNLSDEIDFMETDRDTERDASESSLHPFTPSVPPSPITVSGYVSLPSLTRANRNNIDLFVNRRYVEDRSLTYAVTQAYHTLLPGGRFPIAAIFIDIDPAQVDVNVHPQKTQVRFHEERRVFSAVQKAVRSALLAHAPVPDMGLPEAEFAPRGGGTRAEPGSWQSGWSERRDRIVNAGQQSSLEMFVPEATAPPPVAPPQGHPAADEPPAWLEPESPETPPDTPQPATPEQPSADPAAPSRQRQVEQSRQLPPLRVVGQVGAMYIVTEGPEGLFLIDQHAAHERILYEQFMAQRYAVDTEDTEPPEATDNGIASQQLLEPLTLHAGSEMAGLVANHLDELNGVGFVIEPFGGDTFLVRAVPAVLAGQDPQRVLEEITSTLGAGRNLVHEEMEARLVKMICKRAAIKAGQVLSEIEMRELVRQLEACQSPRTCPHGRPTMIQLSAGELEKAFGRT